MTTPGRVCPLEYRYGASALCAPATLFADTLWIAGGLYGNPFALRRVEEQFHAERGDAALVFNGDFHWFDVEAGLFREVQGRVDAYAAIRGNIEAELAQPLAGAGCGCAYPEWVGDATVDWSNRIMERLRGAAAPDAAGRLAALPMFRIAEVGGTRVAIVHGDADSLAGWNFSQETLATAEGRHGALAAFAAANVSVFASSHTCLPVLQGFEGGRIVVNNGSAGMPNLSSTAYGIATRISLRPSANALYGKRAGPLHVEAVAIPYDAAAWRATFLDLWPPGSEAHQAYFSRICDGPRYGLREALRA